MDNSLFGLFDEFGDNHGLGTEFFFDSAFDFGSVQLL